MHIIYDWSQSTAMTLVIQGQGHSASRRVVLSTNVIINTLFIMMLLGIKFV